MSTALIQDGVVARNAIVCREHLRMTLRVPAFPEARPGQFIHLGPAASSAGARRGTDDSALGGGSAPAPPGRPPRPDTHDRAIQDAPGGDPRPSSPSGCDPLLRRAFSIAGLRDVEDGIELDVIYRVVGAGTRWMASLGAGDRASVLGPLGHPFPIHAHKSTAYLVGGGVGLPPLLWLAQALAGAGKRTIALCGARSASLLPLTRGGVDPCTDAREARPVADEFAGTTDGVVIATDDGSLGFHGHVGAALEAYLEAQRTDAADLVVYTCGPERMMRWVAGFCAAREIECLACLERAMACGTGVCQSCVVPVHEAADPEGWRYALCCTEGPVFDARLVAWDVDDAARPTGRATQ